VRLRLFGLLAMVAVFPASAAADPVVVLGAHGHTSVRDDRFLTGPGDHPCAGRVGAHHRRQENEA
jgi:hypothetical protein